MSLKPVKKSDTYKSWMKPRRDVTRSILPEYHLIVTEGTKTEPQYFQSIKDKINKKYKNRIYLDISGEGENTLRLFNRAKELSAKSPNVYKHVWVVYDTDDFPADSINRTAELCKISSNSETHYHAIWSNQCIELWYLLHFDYFQSDIHRKEYWSKLSKYLAGIGNGKYRKNRSDIYQILLPYLDTAIANAEKLDKANKGKLPSDSAPGTKVFELIKALKPYIQ